MVPVNWAAVGASSIDLVKKRPLVRCDVTIRPIISPGRSMAKCATKATARLTATVAYHDAPHVNKRKVVGVCRAYRL